ncbi:GNAT family N-acetyltransferase [Nocardioides sp. P5_C9_2]
MNLSPLGVRATAGTIRAVEGVVLHHTWTDEGLDEAAGARRRAPLGRVMVTSWLSAHEGQMPDEAWRRRVADWTPDVSAQGWARVLVYGRPADDDDAALTAEVRGLYVDPTCRRRGVGAALLRAAVLELSQLAFSTVRLEVLSANPGPRVLHAHGGTRGRPRHVRRGTRVNRCEPSGVAVVDARRQAAVTRSSSG